MADPMPGISVSYPFEIVNGVVRMQSDSSTMLRSRIVFLISTQVGERVMRPGWGIDILNSYMALGAETDDVVAEAVEEGFRTWFPGVMLNQISVSKNPIDPSRVFLDLTYTVDEETGGELARIPVMLTSTSDIPFYEGAL